MSRLLVICRLLAVLALLVCTAPAARQPLEKAQASFVEKWLE